MQVVAFVHHGGVQEFCRLGQVSWVGWCDATATARGCVAVCVICVYHNQSIVTLASPCVLTQTGDNRGIDSRYYRST